MAFVAKKDLIEKVRPVAERLAQLQGDLEELVEEIVRIAEDIENALDEAED